ncbi:MAG: N-acetylmuramoyl-L-alanine amidase family protein [Chitinophagaceae bacterium]
MKNGYLILLIILYAQACAQTSSSQNTSVYWYGKSTGKLPQLSYSFGEDRLGSAKLGYIDTGIVLKIIDSTNDLYKIQLSKYHTAYIAKADVQRDSTLQPKQFYLTNNWKLTGGKDAYDTVFINMDERLPYKSWMQINPSKIMIELYGVESNTNWITQLTSVKEIKNIYFTQTEDDVVQITIELQHKQHWGYTIKYNRNKLMVLVKKQPAVLKIQKLKIAIDAGHGGANFGATGITSNALEKDYTLIFAKALQKYLETKSVKQIIMTRTTDTSFGNTDRVLWLQQQQPDLLISLHLNSSQDTSVQGSSTYYKHIGFRSFSTTILKQMLAAGMKEYGNVGNFNFLLDQPTDFPNTLLEIGFLSNVSDENKILSPKFQTLVAKQVYLGIIDFLNQVK